MNQYEPLCLPLQGPDLLLLLELEYSHPWPAMVWNHIPHFSNEFECPPILSCLVPLRFSFKGLIRECLIPIELRFCWIIELGEEYRLVKEVVHSVGSKGNVSGYLMRTAFSVEGKPSDYWGQGQLSSATYYLSFPIHNLHVDLGKVCHAVLPSPISLRGSCSGMLHISWGRVPTCIARRVFGH